MVGLRSSVPAALAFPLLAAGCGTSSATAVPSDGGGGAVAEVGSTVAIDGAANAGSGSVSVPIVLRPAATCPDEAMVRLAGGASAYCIDRWEAYVVELDAQGLEHPHSPYAVVDGLNVRAKSAPGVVPQGYISQVQATLACGNAGKRLCSADEFHLACEGPDATNWYPYGGETHIAGYCNEGKGSMVPVYYGSDPQTWTYADFNDPRLNQIDGGLAPTASYPHCESPAGLFDCVGNLHEWGSDPADANGHGRFRGGFYGDAEINGHGCLYVTSAHELAYHDYSTGFRCCADAIGSEGK
jgi:sulfatase modifying factor 1